MRVSRVEFNGFRRLAATATNFDGPLTAFVGFNEAGKTSLLNALIWFTEDDPLSPVDYNRSRPPADETTDIVKVYYELDDEDRAAIAHIPMDQSPATLILNRRADGKRFRTLEPKPVRASRPFVDARARLEASRKRLARQFDDPQEGERSGPTELAVLLSDALLRFNDEWEPESIEALTLLCEWLWTTPSGLKQPRDAKLARQLDEVLAVVSQEHPSEQVWQQLKDRRPDFVMFREADRLLETSYEISPEHRPAVHPAVSRLLSLAEVDLDVLWSHIGAGDSTKRETLLERGNDCLRKVFSQAWNQSHVTVRLNVNGHRLEVLIKELDGGGDVTNISERSDGMKTFVALVAFLETREHTAPPVLLIDEAETHLHYDAQADLVSVLLKSVDTTQVFYTTHSPGCLPADLGTGIRVVARDSDYPDASIIKGNFWEGEGPGFSPLLFAMGAGAAAFSMCRNAVLAEGAADMVLLPTLIRMATGLEDLDYQIAPGLANAHGSGIRVEEVAARVVYLTDGDAGGDNHERLLKAVDVDPGRIFRLPHGQAVEDLVRRDDYLATVNGILAAMGTHQRFLDGNVRDGTPIAGTFKHWAKSNSTHVPGKVEIAYALLRQPNLRLTPDGRRALRELHRKFTAAFSQRPS